MLDRGPRPNEAAPGNDAWRPSDAPASWEETKPAVSADVSILDDWPTSDPIDLATHDRPHASASLERWNLHARFETETGRRLGVFAIFLREAQPPDGPGQGEDAHYLVWAAIDAERKQYHSQSAVDRYAPARTLVRLNSDGAFEDGRVQQAMRDVLERNRIPGPTRIFRHTPNVMTDRLSLDFDGNRLVRHSDGAYELQLFEPDMKVGASLSMTPKKPATRHGDRGVVRGPSEQTTFHYFIPRCSVNGVVRIGRERYEVRDGSGWYDHAFGVASERTTRAARLTGADDVTWSWAALQLDDGRDVAVYSLARLQGNDPLDLWVVISEPDGTRKQYARASLRPVEAWRSSRTFVGYPITWTLRVPEARLSLRLEASFPEQEVMTVLADPGFWQGEVRVAGMIEEQAVIGRGWVAHQGTRFRNIDELLGAVAEAVRDQVGKTIPQQANDETACHLSLGRSGAGMTQGIDGAVLARTMFAPIREIVERSVKAWRSFALLGSIDAVGGDSSKHRRWLALPEISHAGRLVLEDVETQTYVRRAGPACHVLHGEPIAINAGAAAPFFAELALRDCELPPDAKLHIAQLFFDEARARHVGQALELAGTDDLLAAALESGRVAPLERRVLAIHRLKAGIPAGIVARVGAILGQGTETQIEALGSYFEAIGLAMRIADEVARLRSVGREVKAGDERARAPSMTLPIVRGLERVGPHERAWIVRVLRRPLTSEAGAQMAAMLEQTGALAAAEEQARGLVEAAWACLDPVIPDCQPKVLFRAFGWYVLSRDADLVLAPDW